MYRHTEASTIRSEEDAHLGRLRDIDYLDERHEVLDEHHEPDADCAALDDLAGSHPGTPCPGRRAGYAVLRATGEEPEALAGSRNNTPSTGPGYDLVADDPRIEAGAPL